MMNSFYNIFYILYRHLEMVACHMKPTLTCNTNHVSVTQESEIVLPIANILLGNKNIFMWKPSIFKIFLCKI